jgi:hypothetical protein
MMDPKGQGWHEAEWEWRGGDGMLCDLPRCLARNRDLGSDFGPLAPRTHA